MKAPEKIYLEKVYPDNGVLPNGLNYYPSPDDIEYTRTDAFVEKACKFLFENYHGEKLSLKMIEDFKKYMKGE